MKKSSIEEIRERFDNDVERFSNLETGQTAAVDAAVALDLVAEAAAVTTPRATRVLDVGCGAGNFTLRLLERLAVREVTLIDLSRPMLDRAAARIREAHGIEPAVHHGDFRAFDFAAERYDVILAGAVLHHLRTDTDWETTFSQLHRTLTPGGSLWIFDMVTASTGAIQSMLWRRYGEYLVSLKDEAYREHVFAYIEKEDSPRPIVYQLDLLRRSGFASVEVLHCNTSFAAFGGIKSAV
jgi:tRNA (cmo5U34)-methyltransferase